MKEALQRLDQDKLGRRIEDSLEELLPKVAQLVCQEFCPDCPRRNDCTDTCYFSQSAWVMTSAYLNALVEDRAKLN